MINKLDYKNHIVATVLILFSIIGIISYNILLSFTDSLNAIYISLLGSSIIAVIFALIFVQIVLYRILEIDRSNYLLITSNKEFEEQFFKLNLKKSKVTVHNFNKAVDLYEEHIKNKENEQIELFKIQLFKINLKENKGFINL